jgi:methionyl aminopeptidase
MGKIKSATKIKRIEYSCRVLANMLHELKSIIREGVNVLDIEKFVNEYISSYGGRPSFKGWMNYPTASCCSINDEVIHGIPRDYILQSGDIIGVDVGMEKDGGYGDTAFTYLIGEVSPEIKLLCETTEKALYIGIDQARPGNRIGDISATVQTFVESQGYSVVREYCGHGVGDDVWEDPQIPNHGRPGYGPRLKKGMVVAIEPMVNLGKYPVKVDKDGWTVRTKDGLPSAHYEHTILITDGDPVILTMPGELSK